MFQDILDSGGSKTPWRPVVEPWRPPKVRKIRSRMALPGQQYLPGMGLFDDFAGSASRRREGAADKSVCKPTVERLCLGMPSCPNCGGTEFNSDGDCTRCWESGAVASSPRPASEQPELS